MKIEEQYCSPSAKDNGPTCLSKESLKTLIDTYNKSPNHVEQRNDTLMKFNEINIFESPKFESFRELFLFKAKRIAESYRDYTYIDDIVEGIYKLIISKNTNLSRIYNLGNSNPITLNKFIETCEKITSKKAIYNQIGNQQGDVPHTYSDINLAKKDFDYNPKVSLEEGLTQTYKWLVNK